VDPLDWVKDPAVLDCIIRENARPETTPSTEGPFAGKLISWLWDRRGLGQWLNQVLEKYLQITIES
jgi:hypothetical protein